MTNQTLELELDNKDVSELISVLSTISMTTTYNATAGHSSELARIADELRQQKEEQMRGPDILIGLCGLPGAGKSYVGKTMSKVYDCPMVSMGDAIREAAPKYKDSDELGEFAAEVREDDPEQIPEWTVELIRGRHPEVVIVDGIRSVTDFEVLARNYDLYLLHVKADTSTRLTRLQNRGREGEESFSRDDLNERDEREFHDLGFAELLNAGVVDLEMENNGSEQHFYLRFSEIVHRVLPPEVQNGDVVTNLTP